MLALSRKPRSQRRAYLDAVLLSSRYPATSWISYAKHPRSFPEHGSPAGADLWLLVQAVSKGYRMVRQLGRQVFFVILLAATGATAQTVTGSGTSGTVPQFTGTSTVGNSPISISGGNVGIGTTNPTSALQITTANSAAGALRIYDNSGGEASVGYYGSSGDQWVAGAGGWGITGSFTIGDVTVGIPRFVIDSSGNVGIGQVNPGARLDVLGTDTSPQTSGVQVSTPTFPQLLLNATGGGADAKLWRIIGRGTNDFEIQTLNDSYAGEITAMQINRNSTSIRNVVFPNGNVGIGTTTPGAPLEVNGNIKMTYNPSNPSTFTFADGTIQTTAYTGTQCTGADYAEAIDVTGDRTKYEPGDVLVIDPGAPGKFLKANASYSTLVAGIYSTKPGFVGRKQPAGDPVSANEVPMAMVGRVPTKVSAENGPIKVGDLLVTSFTLGYAMKGTDRSQMLGAVVGKALGSLDSGTGVIEVLVTLQ
jgi:hypothetical protein